MQAVRELRSLQYVLYQSEHVQKGNNARSHTEVSVPSMIVCRYVSLLGAFAEYCEQYMRAARVNIWCPDVSRVSLDHTWFPLVLRVPAFHWHQESEKYVSHEGLEIHPLEFHHELDTHISVYIKESWLHGLHYPC